MRVTNSTGCVTMNWKKVAALTLLIMGVFLFLLSQTVFRFSSPFPGLRRIPEHLSVYDLNSALSPDGNWLIHPLAMTEMETTNGNLIVKVASTIDSSIELETSLPGHAYQVMGWSPDSSTIALLFNQTTEGNVCYQDKVILLKIHEDKSLDPMEIPIPADTGCASLTWAPDSLSILLTGSGKSPEMLFFDLNGNPVGHYMPPHAIQTKWWTRQGIYYFVKTAADGSTRQEGDVYLLHPDSFIAERVMAGVENPLLFSPDGTVFVTYSENDGGDVLQFRNSSNWEVQKSIAISGKISRTPAGLVKIPQSLQAPVAAFDVEASTRRSYLIEWETTRVWDCGDSVTSIDWRSNIQSASAVRGLGSFEGRVGWLQIPIKIEPIPQTSCKIIK